jgi:hypothetical protein
MLTTRAVAPGLLAAAIIACSSLPTDLTSNRNAADARTAGDSASGGLVPASVTVTGQVLGVSAREPVAGSADTLRHEPLPHARITLKRNILVNGQSAQEPAGTFTADGEGRFRIESLRGGYYIIEASAPGSGYRGGWEYLPATRAAVEVNVYLWRE